MCPINHEKQSAVKEIVVLSYLRGVEALFLVKNEAGMPFS
jgi:hypothetical protein